MNALILTLELNPELHTELTEWRTRLFPPDRNYLDAHVTLFHALPAEHLERIRADVRLACARASFAVRVPGPFSLGRGVALSVDASEINPIRSFLRERWLDWLTPQDARPKIRPHVTVQNKVTGDEAKRGFATVRAAWPPDTTGLATGLKLWEYRGGPWEPLEEFEFES